MLFILTKKTPGRVECNNITTEYRFCSDKAFLHIRSGQENCFRPFPKKEKEEKSMNNRGKYRAHSKGLRVLAVVLTLSMLLGMSGIQAFAEEDTVAKIPSGASTECDQGEENMTFTPEKQMKGITVKASAAKGVLPADVTFSVTALKSGGETAEQYKEVETALTEGETAYDGFQAFDMSFEDENGACQPTGGKVAIELQIDAKTLAEEVDLNTIAVQQLIKTETGLQTKKVVDAADGKISVDGNVITAKYDVESVSAFALTWTKATASDESESSDGSVQEDVMPVAVTTFSLEDHIKDQGTLNVPESVVAASYKWFKSDNGTSNWTEVVSRKITGDSYNISEDGKSLNAALDNGARKYYKVEIYDEQGNKTGESTATQVSYYSVLQNGSFETPLCNNYSDYQPYITSDTQGIVWKTTASDNKIEIVNASPNKKKKWSWETYQSLSKKHHQVDVAADGEQFAELNANEVGSLYQDVLTTPGATLNWGLAHRARGDKTAQDTMYVLIMPTKLAENINNQADVEKVIEAINKGDQTYKGATVQKITDDNQKWYTHTGTYEVPEGQYLTRFFFVSGPTAYDSSSGAKENLKGTIGNHLDNVYFTSELPQPNPDTGHLKIVKTIQGLTQEEATDYSVDVKIEGPNAYTTKTVTLNRFSWNEEKQAYTATYVEQNVPIGSYTVSEVADSAQRDGYTVSTKVNETDSPEASGSVSIQDRTTSEIWFENTYTPNTYALSVTKILTKGNDYADRTKAFDIDITLKDKNEENVSGEFDTDDGGKISFTDGKATVSLKDNETIKIVGIPAQATYEVQETSDSSKGYDVQYAQKTGTMDRDQSVTVTNTAKDIPVSGVDTGDWVAGGILMAALMVAAGSIYVIICQRMKRVAGRRWRRF